MLDYRIRTFLTLCNTKSYTKAAQELNLTQPAVTQQIKYLESQYNTRLFFFDKKRKLHLTEQGEKLRNFALCVESDLSRLLNNFSNSSNSNEVLKIGTIQALGENITPLIIASYLRRYPNKQVSVHIGASEDLLPLLQEGSIHLCLTDTYYGQENFESHHLFSCKSICLCAPSHPLAEKTVELNALNQYSLIFREKGTYLERNLSGILHRNNYDYTNFHAYIEAGTINAVKQLVCDGLGITFLYDFIVKDELHNGLLKEIYINKLESDTHFNIAWMKNSFYHLENLEFFTECQETLARHFAQTDFSH